MLDNKLIHWIKSILSGIEKFDKQSGKLILEHCGRECAKSENLSSEALKVRAEVEDNTNIDLLFNAYKEKVYNSPRLYKIENTIFLEYHDCGCPIVNSGKISDPQFCNCTVGYTKERFENLFNRPVRVELLSSILKGDKICKQVITLEE